MKTLADPVLGQLLLDRFFWERPFPLSLFGKKYEVVLQVEADEDNPNEEPSDQQRSAYTRFVERSGDLLGEAEQAIFRHYKEVAHEYREMFGGDADRRAPLVSAASELATIVKPTALLIPVPSGPERIVGLLCDCSWEPGQGLVVKFSNEAVVEVGTQDIVL
jgi:hypothetical protein